jgi:hypothetical protein
VFFGTLLAYAAPPPPVRWLRSLCRRSAGVAANMGACRWPRAPQPPRPPGVLTKILNNYGVDLYKSGFDLGSVKGLIVVYRTSTSR